MFFIIYFIRYVCNILSGNIPHAQSLYRGVLWFKITFHHLGVTFMSAPAMLHGPSCLQLGSVCCWTTRNHYNYFKVVFLLVEGKRTSEYQKLSFGNSQLIFAENAPLSTHASQFIQHFLCHTTLFSFVSPHTVLIWLHAIFGRSLNWKIS